MSAHDPALAAMPPLPAGPAREALVSALDTLDAAERQLHPAVMSLALAKVGHCCSDAGALAQAEWYLQRALRWSMTLGSADGGIDLICDLAELAVRRADDAAGADAARARSLREQARDRCFEAASLASRAADPHWEVHVLLRVSEVLDRCGDHDDAISLQCRALHLLVGDTGPADTAFPSLTAETAGDPRRLM